MAHISLTNTSLIQYASGHEFYSMASFFRPADVTAYAAGDVVSDSSSAAKVIAFVYCPKSGKINSATLSCSLAADFTLFLFEVEPTNHLDNAPLTIPESDIHKAIGSFEFKLASAASFNQPASPPYFFRNQDPVGTRGDGGACFVSNLSTIFGLLVVKSIVTPTSASKIVIRLSMESM